jgi:DNA helicase IV
MAPFRDSWRLEELTVNYRTPAQIAGSAEAMAEAHGLTITRSTAVREGDWPVEITEAASSGEADLAEETVRVVEADRLISSDGTLAVIASRAIIDAVATALAEKFGERVGRGAEGLTREIAVLTPQEAKGLEFDVAVVVDPQRVVDEIQRGAAALYVAMTRPTQRLHLVSTGVLPLGIRAS